MEPRRQVQAQSAFGSATGRQRTMLMTTTSTNRNRRNRQRQSSTCLIHSGPGPWDSIHGANWSSCALCRRASRSFACFTSPLRLRPRLGSRAPGRASSAGPTAVPSASFGPTKNSAPEHRSSCRSRRAAAHLSQAVGPGRGRTKIGGHATYSQSDHDQAGVRASDATSRG